MGKVIPTLVKSLNAVMGSGVTGVETELQEMIKMWKILMIDSKEYVCSVRFCGGKVLISDYYFPLALYILLLFNFFLMKQFRRYGNPSS